MSIDLLVRPRTINISVLFLTKMKPCRICGLYFRDKYNLERHMGLKHRYIQSDQEEVESVQETDDGTQESDAEESEEKRPRDIFDNDDSDHTEATDTENETNDSEDEMPHPETDTMIDNVYDQFEAYREAVIETLMREGRDEEQAKKEAHHHLVPKYRKAFRQKLTETLVRLHQIRQEPVYKVVMDTAKDLRSDGLGRKESIRAAISKRKHKINEYIPDELEDEDEDDTDEEDDEPNSKKMKSSMSSM